MSKVINVAELQRASVEYDPILRTLPYVEMGPRIAAMGIRFISSDKELRQVNFERKGGAAKPYVAGIEDPTGLGDGEVGKIKQSKMVPEWGHTSLVEDIMNYEDVNVISNAAEHVDPITKKHPQELLIISSVVKTVGEDLLDALYFAARDEEDESPLGLFDGINTLVDALVTAGEITTGKGNLVNTGAIIAPSGADDTDAYDKVVAFLRSADPALRRGGAILKMTQNVYYYIMDALANKLSYKGVMAYDMLMNALQGDAGFAGLVISVEPEMGTGDRLYLTKAQNFDFNLWTDPAAKFVQVRDPFKNPNLVQYWSQWKAGSRVRVHHKKEFQMNDGTATGQLLSGDYYS